MPTRNDTAETSHARPAQYASGTASEVDAQPVALPTRGARVAEGTFARRRLLARVGGIAVLLLAIGLLVAWFQYYATNVVAERAVTRGDLIELGTRLDGVLATVDAQPGERVHAGQVIAHLEQQHLISQVREAEASLTAAERELDAERLAIPNEELLLISRVSHAAAAVSAANYEAKAAAGEASNAEQSYRARQALLGSAAISAEEVRTADTHRQTMHSLLEVARMRALAAESERSSARIEHAGLQVRRKRLDVLEANVNQARARLERARADLEASNIRAPSDGGIVRWQIHQGGSVKAGMPIVSMWAGRELWIEAWFDESQLTRVQPGDVAVVTLPAAPGSELRGVVESLGTASDLELSASELPESRLTRMRASPAIGVRIRLPQPPPGMMPGLSAEVAISPGPQRR